MPLASLDLGAFAEHLTDGLAQASAAIDDTEHSLLKAKASIEQIPKQLYDRLVALGGCLREAEHLLVAGLRHPHADNHLLSSDVLSVDPQGQEVVLLQGAALELLQRLLGPLLKPAAHRRLAQSEAIDKLARDPTIVSLREAQQD
ncbi:hypothetical protein GGQ15_002808 [Salinibacter ruber]|nr:hypothetical protein [Salinibacter ruber]MCS4142410.1 hypothetical protein [Salinibacter ruber]